VIVPLNHGWQYSAGDNHLLVAVDLPHSNLELPFNSFDEKTSQFVSRYERDVELPEGLSPDARVFVDFEGVMTACDVFVNGEPVGTHLGGYTPFAIEVTGRLHSGKPARLTVRVDSTERRDIPPFGHVVDYLCYGGLYREVALRVVGPVCISDVHATPRDCLKPVKALDVAVALDAKPGQSLADWEIGVTLQDGATVIAQMKGPATNPLLALANLTGLALWETDAPQLYTVVATLFRRGQVVETTTHRIGFRTAEFRAEGFFLNGRHLPIRGLNRHQSWPYQGYAMPERAQRHDAQILKNELGVNLVRTSHYPPSRHFLDACDELGLLVFEEFPGWQHIGDAAWKQTALQTLREMIVRDRSRPSVVLWGVRINESADDDAFYRQTNAVAHELDPARQTGGGRCIANSTLLEDVYTFNDFTHAGGNAVLKTPRQVTGLKRDVPYLVTEHNGHMFPSKRFDSEEHLMEHALRHARVLNAAAGTPGIAGAIGWGAFDYNTHKDFGSGDRICYHGVSDLFRLPKYAAAVYASQRGPEHGTVLEAASVFSKGEREGARLLPLAVFTNCDHVVLYRGGERIGAYHPAFDQFPHLAHPPVLIRDIIGDRLAGGPFAPKHQPVVRRLAAKALETGLESLNLLELAHLGWLLLRYGLTLDQAEALISGFTLAWGQTDETWDLVGFVGGAEVARHRYGGDARADRLTVTADDAVLSLGESWDTTRVVLRLEDQYGNLTPYASEAVTIDVEGPLRILGPSLIPLVGGCAAFWVRTTGQTGEATVTVRSSRFGVQLLALAVTVGSSPTRA